MLVDLTDDADDNGVQPARRSGGREAVKKGSGRMSRSDSVVILGDSRSPPAVGRKRKSRVASPKSGASGALRTSVVVDLTESGPVPPRRNENVGSSSRGGGLSKAQMHIRDAQDGGGAGKASGSGGEAAEINAPSSSVKRKRKLQLPGGEGEARDEKAAKGGAVEPHHRKSDAVSSAAANLRPCSGISAGACSTCDKVEDTVWTQCGHTVCETCIIAALFHPSQPDGPSGSKGVQRRPLDRQRGCNACGNAFSEHDMLAFFPREEVDRVILHATLAFLDTDPTCVKCPKEGCSTRITLNSEAINRSKLGRVAPDGQELTKAAAVHMAKHRIRCPDCSTNFCSSCMAVPYHMSLTCEGHKERQVPHLCPVPGIEPEIPAPRDLAPSNALSGATPQ